MRTSVRLGLAFLLVSWTLAIVVAAAGGGSDVLVVLLLIGLLVVRELAAQGATRAMRARVGIFVFAGLAAFALIVIQRVRQILNL